MKKIVMLLIIVICVAVVFIAGVNLVKPKIASMHTSFYAETKTFYAEIKEIKEYNGTTTLLVEGLESNDINRRGEFTFNINKTQILLNNEKVDKSYLKKGTLIIIGKYDAVQETYPARLVNVKTITIVEE